MTFTCLQGKLHLCRGVCRFKAGYLLTILRLWSHDENMRRYLKFVRWPTEDEMRSHWYWTSAWLTQQEKPFRKGVDSVWEIFLICQSVRKAFESCGFCDLRGCYSAAQKSNTTFSWTLRAAGDLQGPRAFSQMWRLMCYFIYAHVH